jgi:ribonuclease HII
VGDQARIAPDFSLEEEAASCADDLYAQGVLPLVLGLDEAGRGPWAGPVTAAAVWIAPDAVPELPTGLDDSKKLSPEKRADLFAALKALGQNKTKLIHAAVSIPAKDIDTDGILPSTFRAMDEAAIAVLKQAGLHVGRPTHLLVDGNLAPPFGGLQERCSLSVTPVVKGDQRSLSIAAASIIAKETRDQIMEALDQLHPGYGWASNRGYGTKTHQDGLAKQGPSLHHRRTYKPVLAAAEKFNSTR